MYRVTNFFALGSILLIAGCGPTIVHVEKEDNSGVEDKVEVVELPHQEPASIPATPADVGPIIPDPIEEKTDYVVLSEPWNAYFRSKPTVLVVPEISKGIADLLKQEQQLIKSVLDSGGSANSSSEYIALKDKLEELKTVIPQAETNSGYVPRSSRRYSYTYTSGGTVYIRSGYYNGYYTVLRAKTLSSSPEMTRSVEGIAHNATLGDLDQRIDALQQIQRIWNRKTAEMSPNGTSGIMRRANLAYLEGLREFAQEFTSLRKELRAIQQKQEAIQKNRVTILSDWKTFEDTRLSLLEDYLIANATEQVEASPDDIYTLPSFEGQKLLFACQIGERTLYFDLTEKHSGQHPFVLINVAPVQQ